MKKIGALSLLLIFLVSCKNDVKQKSTAPKTSEFVFITPLGKKIELPEPSEKLLKQYEIAKTNFEKNPDDIENIIWFGRRTAYLGRYDEAIAIYSDGLTKFPKDARLYRHRGHRYISLRKFDEAVLDLEKAAKLIEGTENEIEPDGMPNAMNIPVSTLHGNIWYHLGLAYYLKHEYEKAYEAYINCRISGDLDDNIVSSTHWLYMIQRRLGNETLANKVLTPIQDEMNIIENHSYHKLCKIYKQIIPVDSLMQTKEGTPSNDAITYGVSNWYFYNGEKEKAKNILKEMTTHGSWSSFGYIAAESDLLKYFKNEID